MRRRRPGRPTISLQLIAVLTACVRPHAQRLSAGPGWGHRAAQRMGAEPCRRVARARSRGAPGVRNTTPHARRRRRPRRATQPASATPITISATDSSCGPVRPAKISVLRRMNSTSRRSRPERTRYQAKSEARGEAVAVDPQPPGDQAHRERLVDRRRVNRHAGRRRDRAVGIAHRPRQLRGDAVVAVARELAADAAEGVAEGERGGADVEQQEVQHPAPARPGDHGERAADQRRRTRRGPSRRRGCRSGRP